MENHHKSQGHAQIFWEAGTQRERMATLIPILIYMTENKQTNKQIPVSKPQTLMQKITAQCYYFTWLLPLLLITCVLPTVKTYQEDLQ